MRAACVACVGLIVLDFLIPIIFGMAWINMDQGMNVDGQLFSEYSGFMKFGEFLDSLRKCWLVRKDAA
jgi:hypothetical protein